MPELPPEMKEFAFQRAVCAAEKVAEKSCSESQDAAEQVTRAALAAATMLGFYSSES
jgi:hypothetical protein